MASPAFAVLAFFFAFKQYRTQQFTHSNIPVAGGSAWWCDWMAVFTRCGLACVWWSRGLLAWEGGRQEAKKVKLS